MTDNRPSITCPVCGMTSYNPNDIRYGYCGNCHQFTSPRSQLFEGSEAVSERMHEGWTAQEAQPRRQGPTRPPMEEWYTSKLLWAVITLGFIVALMIAMGLISW